MSKYFAIEGLDGCGKTELLNRIQAEFQRRAQEFVFLEEPGHDGNRKQLRTIMTHSGKLRESADTNMMRTLLMAADRVLLKDTIQDAVDNGQAILSSRCFMSSVVYQGIIGGQLDLLTEIHQRANLFYPDLILVVRVDGGTAVQRATGRGELDEIEKLVRDRSNEYAAAYDYAASFVRHISAGKTKVVYLHGNESKEDVFAEAMAHIKELMQWS